VTEPKHLPRWTRIAIGVLFVLSVLLDALTLASVGPMTDWLDERIGSTATITGSLTGFVLLIVLAWRLDKWFAK
jgi:hypothetical protein